MSFCAQIGIKISWISLSEHGQQENVYAEPTGDLETQGSNI